MRFTVVDTQRDSEGRKKYIVDKDYPECTIKIDDFCKESLLDWEEAERIRYKAIDSFYDGWNDICMDDCGDLYIVKFYRFTTPIIWQRCKKV